MAPLLEVRDLTIRYGDVVALDGISLDLAEHEILCLLGPSGSGKSTLLRAIAGLEHPDAGAVLLRDRDLTGVPPERRGFGMMFQRFALFPHLSVAGNITFGLEMQGVPPAAREARLAEMLELVGLVGYGERSIFELSGGEQQRVALARSLAPAPPLLMLDEPLGSLDRALRDRLVVELRQILREIGMTAIYVTHDQEEAFAIADRLMLLNHGRKVQAGSPESLYRHPVSRFVATFFGLENHLPVFHVKHLGEERWSVDCALGTLELQTPGPARPFLLIRPEAARLAREGDSNVITGTITARAFRGGHYRLVTRHGDADLAWEITAPDATLPRRGHEIALALRPDAMAFLAP